MSPYYLFFIRLHYYIFITFRGCVKTTEEKWINSNYYVIRSNQITFLFLELTYFLSFQRPKAFALFEENIFQLDPPSTDFYLGFNHLIDFRFLAGLVRHLKLVWLRCWRFFLFSFGVEGTNKNFCRRNKSRSFAVEAKKSVFYIVYHPKEY